MAGLYIHIPFCRKLCFYCDFHFTVSFKDKDRVINAIISELITRKEEYKNTIFNSLYLGGGTPSALDISELQVIFEAIYKHYQFFDPEVTLEANPDDLSVNYLTDLVKYTPVNRLSIGIQSFHDRDLVLMNRRHTGKEAHECIVRAQNAGYTNINADLIYGVPGLSLQSWKENLDTFASLSIPHLSAYHLTFEPKTVFSYYVKKGKLKPIEEGLSLRQFELLRRFTNEKGYEHYEISNFALANSYSRHNLGYWQGETYLGIGPSAHSFLIDKRRWNIANNTKYCQIIEKGEVNYFEEEIINERTAYNEYVMTRLRTKWGITDFEIIQKFGEIIYQKFLKMAVKFKREGSLIDSGGKHYLSEKGIFIADHIMSELMLVEEE